MYQYFIPFYGWIIFHYVYKPHFVYLLICFDIFAVVNSATMNIHVQIFQYLFSILLGIYIGVELLSHMVILCLTFWETTKLFSIAAVPFYIPICTNSVYGFWFLHILTNTCYFLFVCFLVFLILSILMAMRWHLIVILIYISLMISNA